MPVVQYKCPNCGGPLEFNAEKQMFCCEYCLSDFTEEQIKQVFKDNEEKDLTKAQDEEKEKEAFEEGTTVYTCPNCGATVMGDSTTSATFCFYCHSPVILSGRLSGEYKPSKVIPFKYDRESAISIFKQWCKKKWFLPNDFYSDSQIEKLSGIYLPYWLAKCSVDARMDAIAKRVRTWTSGDYSYTNTKEYSVQREAGIEFDRIPADGSSKADDKLMEAIEPFHYDDLKDFSMSFLSGYLAEKYDVDKQQVFPRIKERVTKASLESLRNTISGYTSVAPVSESAYILKTDWEYMLLPVWIMTYKYKGKYYYFAINGQTKKTAGIPPVSIPKLLLFAGIIFALSFLIILLGGLFLS